MATLFKRNEIWYVNYSHKSRQFRLSTKTSHKKFAEIFLRDIELKLFKNEIEPTIEKTDIAISSVFQQHSNYLHEHRNQDYANHVKWQLRQWSTFLENNGITSVENIKPDLVENFLTDELRSKFGKTKKEYLSAIKGALNRAVRSGLLDVNPIASIPNPKVIIRKVIFFEPRRC